MEATDEWKYKSANLKLTEDQIRYYQCKVDWHYICLYQNLS